MYEARVWLFKCINKTQFMGQNSPGQEIITREAVQDKVMQFPVEMVLFQAMRPLTSRELTLRDAGWVGSELS
jgi:hypothetical protein